MIAMNDYITPSERVPAPPITRGEVILNAILVGMAVVLIVLAMLNIRFGWLL